MHELIPFIKDLAIMLSIASIVTVIFQKIGQPVILGYLIAGIIIGPYTPPFILVNDITQIKILAELGIIYLMFSLGLDFNFHKLKRIGFSATITGLFKIIALIALAFLTGLFMKWTYYDSLFFGAALAISSTTIIVKILEEFNLKGKLFTDIVFGILIIEDLFAILMLTALSTVVVTKNIFSFNMILAVMKLVVVLGGWFILGYFVVPNLFRKIIKYINQETLTIISVSLCLVMAVITAYFRFSSALGAFIMGSMFAETPHAPRIKQLTNPLRDVFAAIFFIYIGMQINISTLIEQWQIITVLSLLAITGKILITTLCTFLTGKSINTSVRVGFSMAPLGEFSFIIMGLGLSLNVVNGTLYQIIVGIATITAFASPYLLKFSIIVTKNLDTKLSPRIKYLLESYSAWVYRALISPRKKTNNYKYVIRILLNWIVVAIIFALCYIFILPSFDYFSVKLNIAKLYTWLIALSFSFLPIWGMLYSYKLVYKSKQIPAFILSSVITFIEVIILSVAYFNTWYVPLFIAIIMAISLTLTYNHVENSYH